MIERASPELSSPHPLLQADRVTRFFKDGQVTAVDQVSMDLHRGEYVVLTGKSGCGKSTLLNLLGGLDRPTEGEIRFESKPLAQWSDAATFRSTQLGFVFQAFHLVPVLNAEQNVQLPMFESTLTSGERRTRARDLLDLVGMSRRAKHRPSQLSVGERQRVAIARALANGPSLLLADEPTGNLDTVTAREIFELFDTVHRQGMTLLLVTHDTALSERAQRIIQMQDGRIIDVRQNA